MQISLNNSGMKSSEMSCKLRAKKDKLFCSEAEKVLIIQRSEGNLSLRKFSAHLLI